MFFNNYKKVHGGDVLTSADLEEIHNKITFLDAAKKDLLFKAKHILRNQNIPCNDTNNFKELTTEINKYTFKKKDKNSRFDGNVVDLRDQVRDGEILLMVKAGVPIKFNILTHKEVKFIVEWKENNIIQKQVLNNNQTFSRTAPSTGESSVDGTFKYTVYRIYSPGVIKSFTLPWETPGRGMCWFVSKGIHFEETWFNPTDYMGDSWGHQNLEYIDILNGGTTFIRANGCKQLKEIEADYIHVSEKYTGKYLFFDCVKLRKLPENSIFKCNNFNYTFHNCYELEQIPNIDFSSSVDNVNAFANCKTITNFKNNILKINKNANCTNMASGCTSLIEIPNITYGEEALWEGTNFANAFANCTSVTKMSPSLDLSYCKRGVSGMFQGCSKIIDGPSEILLYNNLNDNIFYSTNNMFKGCSVLRSITGTITSVNVNTCTEMFRGCATLKKAPKCIFPNTLDCSHMYRECSTLITPPDIIDCPKALSSAYIFADCNLLQSTPATINLNSSQDCSYMFQNCKSLVTGPSAINIASSLTNISMFKNCSNLINFGKENMAIQLNAFADNSYMFQNCSKLKTVCDFEGGYNFTGMFNNSGLERHPAITTDSYDAIFDNVFSRSLLTAVDISKINAPNALVFTSMFEYCPITGNVIIDLSKFTNGMSFSYLFKGSKITSIEITFPKTAQTMWNAFQDCALLKNVVMNVPSKMAYPDSLFTGSNSIQSIEINGLFKSVYAISGFNPTFFKTLKVNAPAWENHGDINHTFSKFSTLETCNMIININNPIQIKNNKKLKDMNLTLEHEGILNNSAIVDISGNVFEVNVLDKIMTNLPNVNLLEKKHEGLVAELTLTGNPGAKTCNTSIAANKGWIVII